MQQILTPKASRKKLRTTNDNAKKQEENYYKIYDISMKNENKQINEKYRTICLCQRI